ncbi:MAG: respiratory nitrate reductase subunit gamma [Pseudomonadota bacterium]
MHNFLFGIFPYIALSVLIIGSIVRYERDPFTWKTSSSQLLRRKQLVMGSILFHVGILVIFFGHLVGLLTPIWMFDAIGISHGAKQVLAVVAGGIAGVMALIGGGMLFHRRWTDPRIRKTSSFADIGILALLLAQLVLGIGTIFVSVQHLDGHEMTKFMAWAQGIFTFEAGAADHIASVALIFKLHLVLGLTIFVLFPFTRLVHMLSVPIRYVLRPGYQIVRSRRTLPLPDHGPVSIRRYAASAIKPQTAPKAVPTPAE